ncbi:hypothetical protein [Paenibacillus spongiae]|uniref:Uncharacterized protein n=1 Tax=Paenibacillus spongiae TaxID=2909671 RepID=A0ABY5S184_9BACL|nr:hypothetical protein [Paenibacillus spongiae]UVI27617.1 hypothetical protein L1F29_19310 [Paenibacillus spongiae]
MESRESDQKKRLEQMEQELVERLTSEELDNTEQERKVKAKLSPKYEIRIQTKHDPIVEETKLYREMAQEVDDRYERYMNRVQPELKPDPDKDE